jgi:hypothetical protein
MEVEIFVWSSRQAQCRLGSRVSLDLRGMDRFPILVCKCMTKLAKSVVIFDIYLISAVTHNVSIGTAMAVSIMN